MTFLQSQNKSLRSALEALNVKCLQLTGELEDTTMSAKLVTDLKAFNDKLVHDLHQANATFSSMHTDHIQKLNDKDKQLLSLRQDTT